MRPARKLHGATGRSARIATLLAAVAVCASGAGVAFAADTVAPDTLLDSGPSGAVRSTSVSFAFHSTESGSTQCSLDGASYSACTSPKAYSGLGQGSHTFRVRAIDAAGNVDGTPASRTWTVDTMAPDTRIDSGPSGTYRSGRASFGLSATESGSRLECRRDGGSYVACSATPTWYVANGPRSLAVRAIDAAGNVDATPAARSWHADALLEVGNFEASPLGWRLQDFTIPGWKAPNASATTVTGGNAGAKAGRFTASGSASLYAYAAPWPINSAVAGRTYTVTGSVRSDRPGKTVCAKVREWQGDSLVNSAQQCVTTATSWKAFAALPYTATQSGSELDLLVYQSGSTAQGDTFDLDGFAISDGTPTSVPAPPAEQGDPVLLGFSDVASCWTSGDEAVARLVDTLAGTIAMAGDTEQNTGKAEEYTGCLNPTWARHKARIKPAVGDHEYGMEGSPTPGATPYFDYFGAAAGPRNKGWYSYDKGAWHIVVLNSNCDEVGGCDVGSEQYEWLRQDLQSKAKPCTAAYFHHPLYSSGETNGPIERVRPFWQLLYGVGADFVLSGNDHHYERFAPQNPDGKLDTAKGMRQFIVGTGGSQTLGLVAPMPNSEVRHTGTYGLLKLTLRSSGYDWRFLPQEGKSFTDSGSTSCSPLQSDLTPPETQITSGPVGTVAPGSAIFGFSSTEAGSSFQCSLDGAAYGSCGSPQTYSGLTEGGHVLKVRATDAAGNTDPTPAVRYWTVASGTNLVHNPSFETSLEGWWGYASSLGHLSGGTDGARSARVTFGSGSWGYSIDPEVAQVSNPAAGARYRGWAWIRGAKAGRYVCLALREWDGGSVVNSDQTCVDTTGEWQALPVMSYTATGGDSLEVYAYQGEAAAGDGFDIDAVNLRAG